MSMAFLQLDKLVVLAVRCTNDGADFMADRYGFCIDAIEDSTPENVEDVVAKFESTFPKHKIACIPNLLVIRVLLLKALGGSNLYSALQWKEPQTK